MKWCRWICLLYLWLGLGGFAWALPAPVSRGESVRKAPSYKEYKSISRRERVKEDDERQERMLEWFRRRMMKKEDAWRRGRLWWSLESGRVWFVYHPTVANPPSEISYEFLGFSYGFRAGWAWKSVLVTADLSFANGEEEPGQIVESVGGSMTQIGATMSYFLQKYLLVEAGVGALLFRLVRRGVETNSVVFPIHLGGTIRIPLRTISMGVRVVSVVTLDLFGRGWTFGGFAHLVFQML